MFHSQERTDNRSCGTVSFPKNLRADSSWKQLVFLESSLKSIYRKTINSTGQVAWSIGGVAGSLSRSIGGCDINTRTTT